MHSKVASTCRAILITVCAISNLSASNYGSLLFHGNCITCHHETKSISAPSITTVQQNYKRAFSDKNDFITAMSIWVNHPKVETSIMVDSIDKYELMPELGYDLSTLREISEFIYETDFSNTHHSGHKH